MFGLTTFVYLSGSTSTKCVISLGVGWAKKINFFIRFVLFGSNLFVYLKRFFNYKLTQQISNLQGF